MNPREPVRVVATIAAAGVIAAGCAGSSRGPAPSSSSAVPRQATVTIAGMGRSYRVYAPPSQAGRTGTVALLIALHGGGGSAQHFEDVSGFDGIADREGFVVVYPQAAQPDGAKVTSWNAGDCCGAAARRGVDDVGFIAAVIRSVSADYPIDPNRIDLAGFSNGGMLAYRLACELPGIAAIGVQSATLESRPCRPERPVSLLAIHGSADASVPLTGGRGTDSRTLAEFTPPPQAAATVAAADGCTATIGESADDRFPSATRRTWSGCPRGVTVEFVTVGGGTHEWMPPTPAAIWSFLAAHPRPAS